MNILLTNDDGIHAPGLYALFEALCAEHRIHIVAPEAEMSAVGHAITLASPLRVGEVRKNGAFFGHAVTGTPADCVKIAIRELLDGPPDIIFSGINLGANVGINLLYSGTVSAATEGAFLGVPSVAMSLATRKDPDFRFAARFSRWVIQMIEQNGLRPGTALNVNIPALAPEKMKGIRVVRQGTARIKEHFKRRTDPRGNVYYWLAGETPLEHEDRHTDACAIQENWITLTPIQYDLTCDKELGRLQGLAVPRLTDF